MHCMASSSSSDACVFMLNIVLMSFLYQQIFMINESFFTVSLSLSTSLSQMQTRLPSHKINFNFFFLWDCYVRWILDVLNVLILFTVQKVYWNRKIELFKRKNVMHNANKHLPDWCIHSLYGVYEPLTNDIIAVSTSIAQNIHFTQIAQSFCFFILENHLRRTVLNILTRHRCHTV